MAASTIIWPIRERFGERDPSMAWTRFPSSERRIAPDSEKGGFQDIDRHILAFRMKFCLHPNRGRIIIATDRPVRADEKQIRIEAAADASTGR